MSTSYQKAHCISVFTHYTTSKTKGLTPFFFFCAVDFTSQKICLDGLPCSLTDYGCLGVFWRYVLFPHSMLIQATGYLFIDRATTSWYSEVQALEVEEPSPWIKWILIQPQAILQSSYMPSNRSFSSSFTVQPLETHHMFPRCLDNICLGISRQNTTNVVLILWSLTSRSFLTILGSSGHFGMPTPY